MSDWNDFSTSGIFSARARTYWIYKAIQVYDLANRATLSTPLMLCYVVFAGFLLENNHIDPIDCQQDIKSAGAFFNASCAPG